MAAEQSTQHALESLLAAQAALRWGEDDVERQRPDLQRTAEEIATMAQYPLAPDLEPRFF
jgi:hypothetical protein